MRVFTPGLEIAHFCRTATSIDHCGLEFRCVDLPTLVGLKRAAGRPKDLEAIAELERLLEPPDAS